MQSRPLGFWETIQKTFFDSFRCSGSIVQMVQVEGGLEGGIVARALRLLQQRHPLLRARFAEENGRPAFIAPDAGEPCDPVPLRVLPYIDDGQVQAIGRAEGLCDFTGGFLWRALLFEGAGRSVILFIIHHSIADGHSIVRLVHETMTLCSQLAGGEEPAWPGLPLLPAVDRLLNRDLGPAATAGPQVADRERAQAEPLAYESWVPLEQRSLGLCLRQVGPDEAQRLLRSCRSHGATLTGAVMAALVLAQLGAGRPGCIAMESGMSLRRYCLPELGPEHIGCNVMMLQLRPQWRRGSGFWETALACQAELQQAVAGRQRQGFLPRSFHPAFIAAALKKNIEQAEAERRFAAGICYSNPGVLAIEPQYGPYRVANINSLTCETAGLWRFFFATYSLNGRLNCDFSYAEPLVSTASVEAFADTLIDILVRQARA